LLGTTTSYNHLPPKKSFNPPKKLYQLVSTLIMEVATNSLRLS